MPSPARRELDHAKRVADAPKEHPDTAVLAAAYRRLQATQKSSSVIKSAKARHRLQARLQRLDLEMKKRRLASEGLPPTMLPAG
jgi:hypothetical protein